MLGENFMARQARKKVMKLKEVTAAINAFDKATAAVSYGATVHNIDNVVRLLPDADKIIIASTVNAMAKEFLKQTKEVLTNMGIETTEYMKPEDYRLLVANNLS